MRAPGLAIAIGLALPMSAWARDETVVFTAGFSRLLTFDRAYKQVNIGNPSIADARPAGTENSLWIQGRAVGKTNLTVLDDTNREVFNAKILVTTDPEQVQCGWPVYVCPPGLRLPEQGHPGRVLVIRGASETRGYASTLLYCDRWSCTRLGNEPLAIKRMVPWPPVPEPTSEEKQDKEGREAPR